VLDSDLIHLRRPDGRDWDGFVHVNPQGKDKAMALIYNPTNAEIKRQLRIPLAYAGLRGNAMVSIEGAPASAIPLDRHDHALIETSIAAKGRKWFLFSK
jgi:hypothetical protein